VIGAAESESPTRRMPVLIELGPIRSGGQIRDAGGEDLGLGSDGPESLEIWAILISLPNLPTPALKPPIGFRPNQGRHCAAFVILYLFIYMMWHSKSLWTSLDAALMVGEVLGDFMKIWSLLRNGLLVSEKIHVVKAVRLDGRLERFSKIVFDFQQSESAYFKGLVFFGNRLGSIGDEADI
jgi:hypothetical protein